MSWETVIGLEVHMQLATKTKIFSGSSTEFGAEPNTQANAIDLAMPGTLPVLNEQAVRYAVMFGVAIDAVINRRSVFERKNYFYPDLPKGYQTTQLAEPIVGRSTIDIELADGTTKSIRIHHAHLEEDAGKSLHDNFIDQSGIDLNRAGTPLLEIVTEPDMSSAEEAVAFAKKLHRIVTDYQITDGDMSQGSMRFDVNVSVRKKGDPLGTRTETKNLNSFIFMEEAIALEVDRQIEAIERGEKIVQETRLYNGETKKSRSMRTKEEANDYRYFPCPDLLPVVVDTETIEAIRASLPELLDVKKQRFIETYGLSSYDAGVLTTERALADYFEIVAKSSGEAKLAANWITGELAAKLNIANQRIALSPISPLELAEIIKRIVNKELHGKQAKQLFDKLWEEKITNVRIQPDNIQLVTGITNTTVELASQTISALIGSLGLKQVSDTGAIEKIIDDFVSSNPEPVTQYRDATDEGKRKKAIGYLVGQIMKASDGQANPSLVKEILLKKLED